MQRNRLIWSSGLVVRIALITNRLFLLAVVCGLALTWVFSVELGSFLIRSNGLADVRSEMVGIRLLMLIGIVMALATDRLLSALAQVVASAGAGDPFVAANARRLRTIGWSLLLLQLLDLPCALLTRTFPSLGSAAPDVDVSVGGWVAVLMVFVFSRIFAAGSAMRDELEATV